MTILPDLFISGHYHITPDMGSPVARHQESDLGTISYLEYSAVMNISCTPAVTRDFSEYCEMMYIIVKLSNTGTHCRIPHFRHQYCFLLPPQSRISGLASSPLPLQECVASGGPGVGGGVDHTLIITAATQQEASSSSSSPSPARCGGCCRRCD